MFEKQYEYAVTISRYFLQPIGVWPITKDASWGSKIFSTLMIFLCYSLILFMILLCILHILVEDPNVDTKMKLFGPIIFAIVIITKYSLLMQKTAKMGECLQHVKIDWQNSCEAERKIMNRYVKLNRFLSVLTAIFMYSGGICYHVLMPLFGVPEVTMIIDVFSKSNSTMKSQYSIIAVQKFWPNARVDLICKIMYLLQCCSGYVLDTVTVCTCSLAGVFIGHICAQLKVVITQLRHYVDGEIESENVPFPGDATTLEARLSIIVSRHTRALKFAALVEECLHGIFLVEFIGSTLNICLIGFFFVAELGKQDPIGIITYVILLISFICNIYIFCYIGELLVNQCIEVGSIYHSIQWYNLPTKKAADLIFIMRISQYPIKLTAGKFVNLNLSNFTNVIKTAFAYWNLTRTIITNLKN